MNYFVVLVHFPEICLERKPIQSLYKNLSSLSCHDTQTRFLCAGVLYSLLPKRNVARCTLITRMSGGLTVGDSRSLLLNPSSVSAVSSLLRGRARHRRLLIFQGSVGTKQSKNTRRSHRVKCMKRQADNDENVWWWWLFPRVRGIWENV